MIRLGAIARRTTLASAVCAATLALPIPAASAAPNDAALARQATAADQDATVITSDPSWVQFHDVNGVTCIDDPAGGMGIHFVNGARLNDPQELADEPEAVIYEPTKNGRLRLVAVEYIVTKQAWVDAGNTGVPHLFGRDFEFVAAGSRYGLPDFYELHAWIWKHNPSGFNSDWNPDVTCAYER